MQNNSEPSIIFTNVILMIFWHLIILFFSVKLDISFFDPNKPLYSVRPWERNGKFYTEILKIKSWKDKLPQYVSKNGFSKRSMNLNFDKEYIERFILETCRAEWNHLMCCMYFFISFLINSFKYAFIFSIIPVLANLPFLLVQRFNRIRLNRLLKKSYNNKVVIPNK